MTLVANGVAFGPPSELVLWVVPAREVVYPEGIVKMGGEPKEVFGESDLELYSASDSDSATWTRFENPMCLA